jgi:methyltransferase (TIGR00027 family)
MDIDDIGATSLMTAQLRAQESERTDRIADDWWAAVFVAAAGGALPPGSEGFVEHMREQVAVRTRFLDDTLLAVARAGCAQVVLVAAGMDSRAFRLEWPAGTTVFEVDQPGVLDFKDAVAGEHGAAARCDRRTVAADLRDNWTAELESAGLDPARPTAWLTEGLLYSLDEAAADRLLAMITAASAPASVLASDHIEATPSFVRALTDISPELAALWKSGPPDPDAWLRAQGWNPRMHELADVAARFSRPVPAGFDPSRPGAAHNWLVTADRP